MISTKTVTSGSGGGKSDLVRKLRAIARTGDKDQADYVIAPAAASSPPRRKSVSKKES